MSVATVAAAGWAELVDRVPIAAGAFVLIGIIGVVTRLWLGSEARHRAELDRIGAAHVAELEVLRADVRTLRAEVREVRKELDDERRLRWRAEDAAARRVRARDQEHRGERGEGA